MSFYFTPQLIYQSGSEVQILKNKLINEIFIIARFRFDTAAKELFESESMLILVMLSTNEFWSRRRRDVAGGIFAEELRLTDTTIRRFLEQQASLRCSLS